MKKNKKNHLEEIIVVGARDNNLNNINHHFFNLSDFDLNQSIP